MVGLILACLGISCGRAPGDNAATSSTSGESSSRAATTATNATVQTFSVKGTVRELKPDGRSVRIQHEAIPDYMPAMTMPFDVKEPALLKNINVGDAITFRLNVTDDDSWIDQIQRTSAATNQPAPERPTVRIVREVEPLSVGDVIPDYPLTNELGQAFSIHDFKGKALALTFIFTRCPMPEFCPLLSKRFQEAHAKLKAAPDAPTNWHFLSISFDPHYDSPAILRSYANRYGYDPKTWNFATGDMVEIDALTEQFGVEVFKQGESWDHKLRTVVIDTQSRVQKIYPYNQWTVDELVAEMISAAKVPAAAAAAN
jgi:protein SCO1/2